MDGMVKAKSLIQCVCVIVGQKVKKHIESVQAGSVSTANGWQNREEKDQ